MYQLFLEKTGAYSVSIGITSDSTKIGVSKKVSDVAIQAGYIPEGMEWNDDRNLQYSETPNLGGFSFTTVLLDSNDMDQVQRDTGVIESEEMTFGNRDGVYVRYQDGKQDGSFNQRIYMVCPEQYCVLIMYIGDDVSKDDAIKVAENITLQETDTVLETADMYTWSDYVSPAQEIGADAINTVKDEKLSIYNIGEPLALSVSGEEVEGNHMASEDISVTVDSVQVADDLELLKENDIPKAWLSAVDSEGKLIQNELSYIKNGDGIETLDEVIRKEIDNQKLVYVTAIYTNQGDSQLNHLQ